MRPAGTIEAQPWMTAVTSRRLLAALTADGDVARFVGGCIRDAVLGRPVRDVDVAVTSPPERTLRLLDRVGIRAIPTGLSHGTITAVIKKQSIEVTTLRVDVATDGRRATVAFTDDWAADASRRDFTVNAIYADGDGTLYDPTGGLPDLRSGRIRFIGDAAARIEEDHLRILRFFRFYADYGRPPPDPSALRACATAAATIDTLSGERIRAEIFKLLLVPDPAPTIRLMMEAGVLGVLLPAGADLAVLERLVDVETPAFAVSPLRRLAALMTRMPSAAVGTIAERWRLSRAERGRLVHLVTSKRPEADLLDTVGKTQFLYEHGVEAGMDLALLAGRPSLASDIQTMASPTLPIAGADIIAGGVPSGRRVGVVLADVEAWWRGQNFKPDRDACLSYMRTLVAKEGEGL